MAMIAITTSSSMRVNALRPGCVRMAPHLLGGGRVGEVHGERRWGPAATPTAVAERPRSGNGEKPVYLLRRNLTPPHPIHHSALVQEIMATISRMGSHALRPMCCEKSADTASR